MSDTTTPKKPQKVNRIDRPLSDYQGLPSTLCKGCGHDNITRHITNAYFDMGVEPHKVVKTSGIGCSSKTPAYFIHRGYGINSVHGRMPSVATGAKLANGGLHIIGVSGDGDTASIGMGQFCHSMRRNIDMVYVCENNGVYGLTKGQFSATASDGAVLKGGHVNHYETIDLCSTAILMGAPYVARGFSNDAKMMSALIKTAVAHKGSSFLDVISPCVTFNNHEGSTKSISYVKEHDIHLNEVGFVPSWEQPPVDLKPGEAVDVPLPDGSHLVLRYLNGEHDPRDKCAALQLLDEASKKGEILTGVMFLQPDHTDLNTKLSLPATRSLAEMNEKDLWPSKQQFGDFVSSFS